MLIACYGLSTMKKEARTNIQIRGASPELLEKLRARAQSKGKTMSQYAIDLLEEDLSRPTLDEVLERIRRHRIPVRPGISAAQAVREAREERAAHLADVAGRGRTRTAR
jgi:antitoxin FitA